MTVHFVISRYVDMEPESGGVPSRSSVARGLGLRTWAELLGEEGRLRMTDSTVHNVNSSSTNVAKPIDLTARFSHNTDARLLCPSADGSRERRGYW